MVRTVALARLRRLLRRVGQAPCSFSTHWFTRWISVRSCSTWGGHKHRDKVKACRSQGALDKEAAEETMRLSTPSQRDV